jgi:glycosyltransferase involved in cell wall biosynthesis
MSLPKVTIVTPSFNQANYLEETIASVLSQGYPNIEYIIMDAGSADGSVDIIKRYEHCLTHWVSEPDKGQCDAINKGWRSGTGEILAWINSDDIYESGVIEEAVNYLIRHPDCGMVCGSVLMFKDDDTEDVIWREEARSKPVRECLARMRSPGTTAAFIRRDALEEVGYLDTDLHYWIDPELWFRIAMKWDIGHIARPWYRFRVHSESKSAVPSRFVDEQVVIARALAGRADISPRFRSAAQTGLITALLRAMSIYCSVDMQKATQMLKEAARTSLCTTARLLICRREPARGMAEFLFGRLAIWRIVLQLRRKYTLEFCRKTVCRS